VSTNSENARKIVLDADARIHAAGSDRTKVKLAIYDELRSKGLDDEAELLMTFDAVTRADAKQTSQANVVPIDPPMSQRPKWSPFRNKKASIFAALVLAMLFVISIWVIPFIWTLVVNRVSPVVVPQSHFVGEHGKNKKLIVFVHGVMGDMDNTWVNTTTNESWPEMITHDDGLGQFDVFVYGYASPMMGNASTIQEISVRFLQDLKDSGFFQNYSELEFITHSMGGIITKRMLNMLNNPAEISLLQKVHTVIYISVPSNGANIAVVQSWLSQNPQFKGMDPKTASDFLQSVEGDWAYMLRQRTTSSPFPKTYSAYETLPTNGITVVPQLYTSQLSDDRVIGFDYNHIDIVKPKDRNAEVYRWAKARLLEPSDGSPIKGKLPKKQNDQTTQKGRLDENLSAHLELQGDEDAGDAIQAESRLIERKPSQMPAPSKAPSQGKQTSSEVVSPRSRATKAEATNHAIINGPNGSAILNSGAKTALVCN
jgi:hypothetical protein